MKNQKNTVGIFSLNFEEITRSDGLETQDANSLRQIIVLVNLLKEDVFLWCDSLLPHFYANYRMICYYLQHFREFDFFRWESLIGLKN